MRNDEKAAVAAAAAMFAAEEEEGAAEETAAQQEAEEVAEQGAETTETEETPETEENLFPSWEIELPEEMVEELESPTDEEIQEDLEENEEGYYDLDESGRQLLARARAAERRAEHFEQLRVKEARKSWTEEAQKFFPLSAHVVDSIQADSRKSFLKQAKAAHEAVVPYVKQITDQAREAIETEKTKATETARKEAERAWGRVPISSEQPTEGVVTQERLARNRAKGDLAGTIREMIFPKKDA